MSTPISRSAFLTGLAGCAIAAVSGKLYLDWLHPSPQFPCRMLGPSMKLGHMLRDGRLRAPESDLPRLESKVTIVGGGVAGLSAGWWLKRNGFTDFKILELEKEVGGNSSSSNNRYSAYPWGAHYVPLANEESEYVRILFQELGIIEGFDSNGQAIYNELYLCHDPQERLLKDGSFQEGLIPRKGLQEVDKAEMAKFFELMSGFRNMTGADGKPAFAIPIELSSRDPELHELDKISMSEWLRQKGFQSRPLLWYVNYCCRDDYGSSTRNVSAWAGIHYFAGRRGSAANAETNSVVTSPEGNGFLVNALKRQLVDQIVPLSMVTNVTQQGDRVVTTFCQGKANDWKSIQSDCVIFAAPRFISRHMIVDSDRLDPVNHQDLAYAPWMVANVSIRRIPDARGISLSWDNVSYYSDSLGYVVATHQDITTRDGPTVVTYYYPLAEQDPVMARRQLFTTPPEEWSRRIVADLEAMHPGIGSEILSMDLWPWGHGMIRPSVGFLWGKTRQSMQEPRGSIYFAHSDMSGISNFEEAQYRGVEAARQVLSRLS